MDFIRFVSLKTGEDYAPFFNKYLYETQLPVLGYRFTIEGDHIVLNYQWTGVEDGFRMPFCIRTKDKRAIRLVGTTTEQTATLENTEWFNFYNEWQGPEGLLITLILTIGQNGVGNDYLLNGFNLIRKTCHTCNDVSSPNCLLMRVAIIFT